MGGGVFATPPLFFVRSASPKTRIGASSRVLNPFSAFRLCHCDATNRLLATMSRGWPALSRLGLGRECDGYPQALVVVSFPGWAIGEAFFAEIAMASGTERCSIRVPS